VDEVNSLDILANGFMFTDIERIEVLRGPQGTLFGRNAMGGVVNIVTRQPSNRREGFAEIGLGNLALQRHSAGFKLPLVRDRLFLGASGLYQGRKGYWINDTTGTGGAEAAAQGRTVGGERNLYGNFYLKWLPSARFSATLNFKAQRDWSDETGFFVSQPSETIAFANPDRIYLRRVGSHDRRISNTSLVLKYYSPAFTLTSISALQRISLAFEDIDFPGFYHSFWESAIGEPLPPQQVLTQEVRISSARRESKLQYTAGVFGFTQEGYEPSTNLAFEVGPEAYSIFRNISSNQGLALFGEASYRITPELKVTAGLRYDRELRESTFNGFGDASFIAGQFVQANPDTTVSGSYSALSPKAVLSYAPSAGSSLYLSYTRGFRAGGVNAQKLPAGIPQTFDPEYSDNFELGGKLLTPGGKLSLGAAAFLIRWQDLQFFNLVAPFTYARENVGDARSAGIELEASAIPVKGLQLDASFGYNATEYRAFSLTRLNFATGEELQIPIGGNRLSNAPASTFFLGAQYTLPLPGKLRITLRGEARRVGEFYTDIQNSLRQPAYTVLNARISVELNQQYSLVFWGQNLNDAVYLAFGTPDTSFGSRSVRTAAPRTVGASLSVKI
jgi:iron complex outermembrane receptor protein